MNFTPEYQEELKQFLENVDPQAFGQFLNGAVQKDLILENWLDATMERMEGNQFVAPYDVIGQTAEKAVRGQIPQTFTVANRKVYVEENRYTSSPEIDIVDLQKGDVIQAAGLIEEAKIGIQDQIDVDAYNMFIAGCKHGDTNFSVIVDAGTLVSGTTIKQAHLDVRDKLDDIILTAEDTTRTRKLRSIIGRRLVMSKIIDKAAASNDGRSRWDFLPNLVPGTFRDIPVVALSGVNNRSGSLSFPADEVWALAPGAAAYSIPTPLLTKTLEQRDFRQRWELLTERCMVLWDKKLIWRIKLITNVAGTVNSSVIQATPTNVVVKFSKYPDVTTIAKANLWVYTGTDPTAGNGDTYTVSVDPTGTYATFSFATPLTAGATYHLKTNSGFKDIGGTAFTSADITFVP